MSGWCGMSKSYGKESSHITSGPRRRRGKDRRVMVQINNCMY
jgi:hypothetical protein